MSEKYIQLQDLPEEIIYQILIKTPAKYLSNKVRYWGKSWQNLISSSDFIYQNIQHNKPELLISNHLLGWEEVLPWEAAQPLDLSPKNFHLQQTGNIRSSTQVVVVYYKVVHMSSATCGLKVFILGCSDNGWKRIPRPFVPMNDLPFKVLFFSSIGQILFDGQNWIKRQILVFRHGDVRYATNLFSQKQHSQLENERAPDSEIIIQSEDDSEVSQYMLHGFPFSRINL
ncbi:hypothetical protein KPL70_017852 [Citrus sinensis]|nr:hypothetical protein KPL70_017852 [Citrus sinensis]